MVRSIPPVTVKLDKTESFRLEMKQKPVACHG